MKNNIYLLNMKNSDNIDVYDYYDGHIIIAPTTSEARTMCPFADEGNIWHDSKLTTCRKIGESDKRKQLILSSFNGY